MQKDDKPFRFLSPNQIHDLFSRFQKDNPHPLCALIAPNAFTLLVSVVLSAQTTDKSVNKVTPPIYQIADTPQKMVDLGEERLREMIRSIGLYRTKAKNVIELSRLLVENHRGEIPSSREALEALPGVGRKTANVVLNVVFQQPTMPVDTHVLRLARRLGLSTSTNPLGVEKDLLKIVPPAFGLHAHHWIILHGRHVCTARKPQCQNCLVNDLCPRNFLEETYE